MSGVWRLICSGIGSAMWPSMRRDGPSRGHARQNLDFIVLWRGRLAIVGGRERPALPDRSAGRERRVWECWSTQDESTGWRSGPSFLAPATSAAGVYLSADAGSAFAQRFERLVDVARAALLARAVPVDDYRSQMRVRSPRWRRFP